MLVNLNSDSRELEDLSGREPGGLLKGGGGGPRRQRPQAKHAARSGQRPAASFERG